MKNNKKIAIHPSILNEIIGNVCKRVPGIKLKKEAIVNMDYDNMIFNIIIFPKKNTINIYNLSIELQKLIHYFLTQQFDVKDVIVNIIAEKV